MKELGMVLVGIFAFGIFFSTMIYPNLEYTGYQSAHTCTGECYEEYVRVHGTTVEILQAKQLCEREGYEFVYRQLDVDFTREELFEQFPGARTFPQIRVEGENIGGYDQLYAWHNKD